MGIQNQAVMVLSVMGDVKYYRDHVVSFGVVQVTGDEFVKHLNSTYGDAIVCNIGFTPGDVLRQVSPLQFERMKRDYEEELQLSLSSQLVQGNDVDIEWF